MDMDNSLKLLLEDELARLLQKLNDNYLDSKINIYNVEFIVTKKIKTLFVDIIDNVLFNRLESDDVRKSIQVSIQELSQIYIDNDIPYVVLINELNFVQNNLMHLAITHKNSEDALELFKFFDNVEEHATDKYLQSYLTILKTYNNNRLKNFKGTLENDLIMYYESHIVWMNDFANALLEKDATKIPQINHHECGFGKWLDSEEVHKYISDDDEYLRLYKNHRQLHQVGSQVLNLLKGDIKDYHACLTYVQRAENISKSLGNDLALVNNRFTIKMATKDPLTGVLNRSLLNDLFNKQYEISAATQNGFVLAMCDLDHFKSVNDSYGHLFGDQVLKHFTELLKEHLRVSDMIIRFGGEEFVLILPAMTFEEGWKVLDNLRHTLQKSIIIYENEKISVTVSIGVIEINPTIANLECKNSVECYLKKADILLYEAKQNGRNRLEGSVN